jgi:hypothetical protein
MRKIITVGGRRRRYDIPFREREQKYSGFEKVPRQIPLVLLTEVHLERVKRWEMTKVKC